MKHELSKPGLTPTGKADIAASALRASKVTRAECVALIGERLTQRAERVATSITRIYGKPK